MEDLKLIIAKNITGLRRKFNLTQAELAEKLNYSDKAVSKWERGESVPDITVLKAIADIFEVKVDYLLHTDHHGENDDIKQTSKRRVRNRVIITAISVLLVWFVATFIFVNIDIVISGQKLHWLAFVFSVPISFIVWLVFNSIWFNKHRNFLIISLLMWTTIASLFFAFAAFHSYYWQLFLLGIPGQAIIGLWSGIKSR